MRPDEKRHLYDAIQGMVDALVSLPETTEAFERWDGQLGVSAKARRLDHATAQAARRRPTRAQLDAQRDATEAFESATAGRDLWDSSLIAEAAALLQKLGYRGQVDLVDLSFHLVSRFVWTAGGWPRPPAAPDFTAGWGYDVKLPAALPPDLVLDRLRELAAVARARKKAEAGARARLEAAAQKAEVWRRRGRLYVLSLIGRESPATLARMQHRELGPDHDEVTFNPEHACESCERQVRRDLAEVRALLRGMAP